MTIDKTEFQKALLDFFNDCERTLDSIDISKYNKDLPFYQLQENHICLGTTFIDGHKKIVFWRNLVLDSDFEKRIENLDSTHRCVFLIRQIFGLKEMANLKTGKLSSDDLIHANNECYKFDLIQLFSSYKEKYEAYSVSIEKFSRLVVDMCFSSKLYCRKTARLLGFKSDLTRMTIGDIHIGIPDNSEIVKIINDSVITSFSHQYTPPCQIALGPEIECSLIWINYWITGDEISDIEKPKNLIEVIDPKYPSVKFFPYSIEDKNIYRLLLSLRLYGNYCGIRTLFSKISAL